MCNDKGGDIDASHPTFSAFKLWADHYDRNINPSTTYGESD
jgi:hypothetical protein